MGGDTSHERQRGGNDVLQEGHGCPICSARTAALKRGINDLLTVSPDLAAQWHVIKNGHLKASDVTANSAAIDWNERGGATQWQICINHDMENLILVDNNPYTLTDLEFDTQYTLMVRSYYDANIVSTWSEPFSFTTAEICPKPKNLTSVPEATEATLSWDGTLDNYVLQYNAGWKLGEDIKVYVRVPSSSATITRPKTVGSILMISC